MTASENYPQLKAEGLYRDAKSQLKGIENRIKVARNRYIVAVQDYSVLAHSFPTNQTTMAMSYKVKPSFAVDNEKTISTSGDVEIDGKK